MFVLDQLIVANVAAAVVSTVLNIWANRRFTFQGNRRERRFQEYFHLTLVSIALIAIQTTLFWAISNFLAQEDVMALNFMRLASVAAIASLRYIIFRTLIGAN